MTKLTITYIIGTDHIDLGSNATQEEIDQFEAYRAEVQAKVSAAYPDARHVDVVVDNGSSKARVSGLSLDEAFEREESIVEEVTRIADDVWNHGDWHNA